MPAEEEHEDDTTLLSAYCKEQSEDAFRLLVERHLPTVWNAARRLVNGDAALAEDISQEVFSHLAQRARTLPPRVVLGGWLYRHTCFTAAKTVRTAVRRRARELTAATAMTASASDPWSGIAPHLDAALQSLSAADRNALVLRFFEKRDYRSIGLALGTSEDAARMKTARAVEKLRSLLRRRGAVLTAAVLASLLGERAVAAPPAGMAAQVASSALTNAGRVATGTLGALWAALMRRKAVIAGGLILLMTGSTLWILNARLEGGGKSPPSVKAQVPLPMRGTESPGTKKTGEVTVHLILVPEAGAVALLNDRWSTGKDKELLESLLKTAGNRPDGIVVAKTLTGKCVHGGRIKMGKATDVSFSTEFEGGEHGAIIPGKPGSRFAGSIVELELTIGDDVKTCDLNFSVDHHFAEPLIQVWSTSLSNPESRELPAAKIPEFRPVKLATQLMMPGGNTQLAAATRLPALPDSPPGTPSRYLFTFVTVSILPPS